MSPRVAAGADFPALFSANTVPVVMLVGRANVGKSTLFNRIIGGGRALVSPIAGTTRDLNLARTVHNGREFVLVDSGGLEHLPGDAAAERAMAESLRAMAAADLVVLVIDGRAAVTNDDWEALRRIRPSGRPIILAVNKVDRPQQSVAAADAWSLGIDKLSFVSAAHGIGIGELLDEIAAQLPERPADAALRPWLRLALIGRPNVGKSSLLNRLAGFERAIVDSRPGTTRDPVEMPLVSGGHQLLLIDTAGIRRPPKVEGQLEHLAVGRALEAIRRGDVLALVIDALEGITDQDARLARLVETNERALIVVCNKWDAAAKAGRKVAVFVHNALSRYPFLGYAPVLTVSALTGDGVESIVPAAAQAGEQWRSQFQTATLNRILAAATADLDPPLVGGKRLRLMYVTQVATAPPRLAVFSNLERDIPIHYLRFLEGRFRAALGLERSGTPLLIELRRAARAARHAARPAAVAGRTSGLEPAE